MATVTIHPEARRSRRARRSVYSRIEGGWAIFAVVAVVIAPAAFVDGHPVVVGTVVVPALVFGGLRLIAWIATVSERNA